MDWDVSFNLDGGYLAIVVDFVQYIMIEKRENKVDVNQYGVMGDIHIALLGKRRVRVVFQVAGKKMGNMIGKNEIVHLSSESNIRINLRDAQKISEQKMEKYKIS